MKVTFNIIVCLLLTFLVKAQSGVTKLGNFNHFKTLDLRGQSGIAIDDTNRVWMSYDGVNTTKFFPSNIGLITFGSDSVWKQIRLDSLGGPSTIYFPAIQFLQGALWLGSDKGLIKKKGNQFTVFTHPESNPNADTVNNFIIKGNVYYMATQSGIHICYHTPFGNSWKKYDRSNSSLPTNSIRAIDIDSKGIFWLATSIGVVRFDPIKNESKIYDKKESEFWTDDILSIKVLPNDEVWAGSENQNKFWGGIIIQEVILPGLFYMKDDKFINYFSAYGYCDLSIIPPKKFNQILNDGNNIVFKTKLSNYIGIVSLNNWAINSKKLTEIYYPVDDVGLITKNKNHLFLSTGNPFFALYKVDLNSKQLDSNYYYYNSSINTSPNPDKEIPANLTINNLDVPLLIKGDLFWNFKSSNLKIKTANCNSISVAGSIWLGGISDGNLHQAAGTYRQVGIDFGNGPLKINYATTDSVNKLNFSHTWKVEERTINDFKLNYTKPGYIIPEVIMNWPAHGDTLNGYSKNLASFIDQNKNGIYEPKLGDYPEIKGQQNHFWIFNDNTYNFHSESGGNHIGVEVHANAYGYVCDQITDQDANRAINNTIFIKYKVINRSNRTYTDFNLGFWMDPRIGNYADDLLGSNPKEGYAFCYNGDTLDEGLGGFGAKLPACALVMLPNNKDSIHKKFDLARFISYKSDYSAMGNPSRAEHYYNYLQGKWKNSQKITYGGDGTTGNDTQDIYMFPGKNDLLNRPEWNNDTSTLTSKFSRFLLSTKNITFKPGEEREITFAVVYTPTNFNQKDLILEELNKDVVKVKSWFANESFPSCSNAPLNTTEQPKTDLQSAINLYPNPSTGVIYIDHNLGFNVSNIKLYNLNGQLLYNESGTNLKTMNMNFLNEGIYLIQLETKQGVVWKKVVKN